MIFSLRWLGNMMQSHWINREKFEQIIYRKQVDFKKPTNYNGSLKSLYSKAVDQLGLTYRPQQLYLAETILDQLMHSEKQ